MTFEEAHKIALTSFDINYADYEENFYYGGREWLEWPEKAQNNIENPNIIGSMVNWESHTRRPYYRMRGRSVTREQAAEIMRYTDWKNHHETSLINFNDWRREDGFIGGDGNMSKWPTSMELLLDMFIIASEFDYLDFFIAITNIDEINFSYEIDWKTHEIIRDYSLYGGIDGWYDRINLGIQVKDGRFDIYDDKKTIKKLYNQYKEMYEVKGLFEYDHKNNPYDVWRDDR